jgi:hypothetical protein
MLADPVFLADMKKAGLPLKPWTGERLQQAVADIGALTVPLVARARAARAPPK